MTSIYVSKAKKSIEVDFDSLPQHIQDHIIEYGLTQKLNDVHSSEKDPVVAFGLVVNLVERLKVGDLSKRASGRNPVEVELEKILITLAKAKAGKKPKELQGMKRDQLVSLVAKALDKSEERVLEHFLVKAEEIVAKRQAEQEALLESIEI